MTATVSRSGAAILKIAGKISRCCCSSSGREFQCCVGGGFENVAVTLPPGFTSGTCGADCIKFDQWSGTYVLSLTGEASDLCTWAYLNDYNSDPITYICSRAIKFYGINYSVNRLTGLSTIDMQFLFAGGVAYYRWIYTGAVEAARCCPDPAADPPEEFVYDSHYFDGWDDPPTPGNPASPPCAVPPTVAPTVCV